MFNEGSGPEKRAHTENSQQFESTITIDGKLTDMLVKENRMLKKLLEGRSEDM
jgi:hypothetical protein